MGLHIAADYGRVVALLQRLPYQKTKPKGLHCGCGLCRLSLLIHSEHCTYEDEI